MAVFYYVFDLLHLAGRDTTGLPLRARKRLLRGALAFRDPIRLTVPESRRRGAVQEACRRGWEA